MKPAHCFSVDVEGFCEGMAESFPLPLSMIRDEREKNEIARNVDEILELLDRYQVRATFFILGIVAEEQPQVVRRIAGQGHEIGSHSQKHLRLYGMSRRVAREAIGRSKKVLEDVSGQRVYGFRAPDFSINRETIFLLDLIRYAGYDYDSSIYPIPGHDVYGIAGAKPYVHQFSNGLIEFPPTSIPVFGRRFPVLGGGYFRLLPFFLSRAILRSFEKRHQGIMIYTHPYEVGSHFPRLNHLSWKRRFRHYVNIERGKARFERLFTQFRFSPAFEILNLASRSRASKAA